MSSHDLNISLRCHISIYKVRAAMFEFGEDTNIKSVTLTQSVQSHSHGKTVYPPFDFT